MSIALFLFSQIYALYTTPIAPSTPHFDTSASSLNATSVIHPRQEMAISQSTFILATSMLAFYVFSIVYGRLYTAMHSFTDCFFGMLLGTAIWWAEKYTSGYLDVWLQTSGWIGAFSSTTLFSTNLIFTRPFLTPQFPQSPSRFAFC